MANYNVVCKVLRGGQGEIEEKIQNYLATVDSTKTIHAIEIARFGADNLLVLIVHDA